MRLLATLALFVPALALACADEPANAGNALQPKAISPLWAGPAISGSWFDPARSGEGIIVQYQPDGTAIAVWFTYPAPGEAGEQAWLIAEGGVVDGATLRFANVYQPKGALFGDAFDPARVERTRWGTLDLEMTGCNGLTARWSGPTAYGSGSRSLQRLTAIDQIDCNGGRLLASGGGRALAGLRARSGAWYVPSRSGEGWLIEELADGRTLVYWFTFDAAGRQAWIVGSGMRQGDEVLITDMVAPRGTRFGSGFDAGAVTRTIWGRLTLSFNGCSGLDLTYSASLAGYGDGRRSATRLASPAGTACIVGTPVARTAGTWRERAPTPGRPQSEHASVVLGESLYVLGGYGDAQGFKRYDASSERWTTLPAMPAGRDHLAAFALGGSVYYTGGGNSWPGDQEQLTYRYDVTSNRWHPVSGFRYSFGSQAAVLNGRAYIGHTDGTLQEYDPRQGAVRLIAAPRPAINRDHAQVLAFQGEIWVLGGRRPETGSVAIYDPVTETWRAGPAMQRPRGGFAAAVVDEQIVVAGGEVIFEIPQRIEPSVEVYAAGQSRWAFGPTPPVAVHGVTAGVLGGEFLLVSGSRIASSAEDATGRMFGWTPHGP